MRKLAYRILKRRIINRTKATAKKYESELKIAFGLLFKFTFEYFFKRGNARCDQVHLLFVQIKLHSISIKNLIIYDFNVHT